MDNCLLILVLFSQCQQNLTKTHPGSDKNKTKYGKLVDASNQSYYIAAFKTLFDCPTMDTCLLMSALSYPMSAKFSTNQSIYTGSDKKLNHY